MALEELLTRLERDMEARVAELRANAETRIARIREAAAEDDARTSERIHEGERSAEGDALGAELLTLHRKARKDRLLARERLLARIFGRAEALSGSPAAEARYLAHAAARTADALGYTGPGTWRVRCSPALEATVRAAAGAQEVIADPTLPLGVRVESTDGAVVIDNTMSARMTQLRPQLAIELLEKVGAS